MPDNIRVIIVNGDNGARKEIADIISSIDDIVIVGETDTSEKGLAMVDTMNPDVIVIGDFIRGTDGYRFSDSVIVKHPFHAIVLVTSSIGEDVYKLAMRSGIKEVVQLPLHQVTLSDAIYRAKDIKAKHHLTLTQTRKESPVHEKSARIISVFSTKGGVGKTTISTNLAVLLKQNSKKVALLDLDVYSGDVALALDIVPKRNISDLVSDISKLDIDLLESYMSRHDSGVMVLPAPLKLEYGDFVAADHVNKILRVLRQEYDYVVIDCASYLHDPVLVSLDASDTILLITTMDLFAIKNLKNCISALEGLSYSRSKFKVVINRAFKEAGIGKRDIAATLGLPITAVLPQEDNIIVGSINQGKPAVLSFKRSKFVSGMGELAEELANKNTYKAGSNLDGIEDSKVVIQ